MAGCGGKMIRNQENVHKGSVLIVDDEPDIVNILVTYLTECGYKAVGCTSGKEAIEKLKTKNFELMFTDLVMPDMDGVELLGAAQKINPYLVGIIITGQGTMQSAIDAIRVRAFDYLLKPFQFSKLSLLIDRAMKVRELRKSEDSCRSRVKELNAKVTELQNTDDNDPHRESKILELIEEMEDLKRNLAKIEM